MWQLLKLLLLYQICLFTITVESKISSSGSKSDEARANNIDLVADKEDNLDDLDQDVTLVLQEGIQISPKVVKGLQDEMLNFTIRFTADNYKKICWESSGASLVQAQGSNCVEEAVLPGNEEQLMYLNASMYGVYVIRFYEEINGEKIFYDDGKLELAVGRDRVKTNNAIVILFTVILGVALALMGLDIDLSLVWAALKRPIGPAVGMVCQFGFMPVSAYFLGWLILETNYERLGLLLLGCSPGGAASNFWTAMFDGDINLSVTMTFFSSVFSFAFTTLWIFLLGSPLVSKTITIPYIRLVISLVSFTVPILIGVAFKHWFPKAGAVLKEWISRPFFFLCLLILPAVGIWNNIHFFYLASWNHLISGLLLGLGGYIAGAGLAYLCRMKRPQIIAISLETAIQNGGIAFIVLNLTFPSPYSDMAVMPILGFFFCSTGPIMMIVYAVYLVVMRMRERRQFTQVNREDVDDLDKQTKIQPI